MRVRRIVATRDEGPSVADRRGVSVAGVASRSNVTPFAWRGVGARRVTGRMPWNVRRRVLGGLLVLALAGAACSGDEQAATQLASAQSGGASPPQYAVGDWPMYRGDLAGTGASPLSQITAANVADLQEAWRYSLVAEPADATGDADADPPSPNSQATPIVVGGVMYVPAGDRVVALEPETGQEIWRYQLSDGAPSRRGVTYWSGDEGMSPRIIFTSSTRLIALDAASGTPVASFGENGEVDLGVPYNSVPLVFQHVVVVGANTPRGTSGGIGNARAFDARTGDKLWEFSSVPQPGAVGHDTWEGESWRDRTGVNAWPFYFTMDYQRGLLYLPLASPIPGAFGGDRGGDNLFGNSVVAVDVHTGEYVWHFQTIHHDLWDADPPAPPVLFDIPNGDAAGGSIAALAVTTKSGYLYILDRETGEPVFGVEERPVAVSEVPGEQSSPTQPIPVKPPPMSRVTYEPADLVTAADTTAEHADACAALVESIGDLYHAGPFTPWVLRTGDTPLRSTLLFPGLVGGPNWGGVAFDRESGYLLVFARNVGSFGWLEEAEAGSDSAVPYVIRGPRPNSFDVPVGGDRWPCQKPPWGRLTAVDSVTGDIAWQRPLGITEELPADRQQTGRQGRAGAIVTGSGMLFIASTDDNQFRALDIATGDELWVQELSARGNANPMTYLGGDENQYVAIVAIDTVVAYALP